MATTRRKSSATSESGAYMSQYDQEVEQRLKVIEAKLQVQLGEAQGGSYTSS